LKAREQAMNDDRSEDEAGIRRAVLDYFEGWFLADADRMARALHPALAKRALEADRRALDETSAQAMIDATARGVGRERARGGSEVEVVVEDVHGDIASATVRSTPYREYLHLARTADGWRIVNTLWAPS
jgi:putative lumazine-binding protein